ncbi:MAG: hypothetical protein LBK82_01170 [Planctomycetaceae bacterium]|nr:hypothetical protein [Planctomycetaceae bacterium]
MFRRNIASAVADLSLCADGNRIANRLATPIFVLTQGHCRLSPTNLSVKDCLPAISAV